MDRNSITSVLKDVKIAIITAVSENGVIGKDGHLPWKLNSEWDYFRETTFGYPLIMGRKTFESRKKPLPHRWNIVVSSSHKNEPHPTHPKTWLASSLIEAILKANEIAVREGFDKIFVIGGSDIYKCALPLADLLYYTVVHDIFNGDTHFPDWDKSQWEEVYAHPVYHDASKYTKTLYRRISNPKGV